ncbi:helix-turn-helix domain-containing protein [Mycetohabitans sp. B46]|uniref:helix-turn-helix domain-containing protein n=1 Tax=Mycetohabitans sp. B46 TaxID=2772536 RepID=UPI00307E9891
MSDQQHPTPHDSSATARRPDPGAAAESARQVGAQLEKLREAKKWSIEDVSARLKVAPHKLRELESGDYSHLPDTTFAIGVVRSYAKMLGADPTPLTDTLRRTSGPIEPELSLPSNSGAGLPRGRVVMNLGGAPRRRPWGWIVAFVIVLVAVIAVWRTGGEPGAGWIARLKTGGADAVEHDGAASRDAVGQTGNLGGAAPAGGQPASATSTLTELPRPAALDASSGADTLSAASTAAASTAAVLASAPASPAIAANAGAGDALPTPGAAPVLADGEVAVTIKVSQDSWFSVRQRDGKPLFSGLLYAGDEKRVQGIAPFRVTVGNKAGIDAMAFDGKPVPSVKYEGAQGNVARFSLP